MSGAIVAGAVIGGVAGWAGSEMMGDSSVGQVPMSGLQKPEYFEDIQEQLYSFGSEGLEGKFPEYYQPLGEIGGQTFEKYLDSVLGDAKGGVLEAGARRNVRGGALDEAMAQTTGKVSSQLRYQDLLRGLQGRQQMLGTSLNTLSNVRQGDLSYTDLVNSFNLNRTGLLLQQAGAEDAWEGQKANMITSGIMGGAQLGGSISGYNQLSNAMSSGGISSGAANYGYGGTSLTQPSSLGDPYAPSNFFGSGQYSIL